MNETTADNTYADKVAELIRETRFDPEARAMLAEILERAANRELDEIADRYGAKEKDCLCVIHDGPCWLHMQRLEARMSADIVRRGGPLVVMAYARSEAARLSDLVAKMEQLERKSK